MDSLLYLLKVTSVRTSQEIRCRAAELRVNSAVYTTSTGMKNVLWPSIWLSAVSLVAAGLAAVSKMGFWWSFLIVAVVILVNGWVATFEDDLPGGFNNPSKTSTPRYAIVAKWRIRVLGAVLALLYIGVLALHFVGMS